MMCQASRDVHVAVSMSFVEDVSKSMLAIIAVELVRRLTQYFRLAWIERTTTYRSQNDNFVFNGALMVAFVFLLILVTFSTEKEARRQVYINILIQAAVCFIPYCFFIHPKLIAVSEINQNFYVQTLRTFKYVYTHACLTYFSLPDDCPKTSTFMPISGGQV